MEVSCFVHVRRRNAKEILMGLYEQIAKDDDLSAKNRMKLSDTPAEEEETENAIIPETGGVGNLNEEGEDNGNLLPYWFYGSKFYSCHLAFINTSMLA